MTKATHLQDRTEQPISLARPLRFTSVDEATGLGLPASPEIALLVKQIDGDDVQLSWWRVTGDSKELDHRAVMLDAEACLDLAHGLAQSALNKSPSRGHRSTSRVGGGRVGVGGTYCPSDE